MGAPQRTDRQLGESADARRWRESMIRRHRKALASATSPVDRLVLIREIARLNFGTFDWNSGDDLIHLSHWGYARRFGLEISASGHGRVTARWVSPACPELPEGFLTSLEVDAEPRRAVAWSPADAALQ